MHPIVARMDVSAEQEPAVAGRGRNLVVTAGAGTGKTRTLVARYLSLLAEGLPLRSLLAVTFTRKAAREMRNRVRDRIRSYLESPGLHPAERLLWQEHYSSLDAARIGTIHAFCAEVLRAHPAEARVDPRFQVLDEAQAAIRLSRAVDEALAWAAEQEDTAALFSLLGEDKLRDALGALLPGQPEVETYYAGLAEPLWGVWQRALHSALAPFLDDSAVQAAFAELLAVRADGTLARALAVGDALAPLLERLLDLWAEVQAAWRAGDPWAVAERQALLRDSMKQKGRAANWAPADPKAVLRGLQARYDGTLAPWVGKAGVNPDLDRGAAEAIPALLRVLAQAAAAYTRLKEERQALDYDDLERGALALLRDHPEVRGTWQRAIRAVLVDEFQDTNGRQRDLVALLDGGEGRLFLVGDAKQSIYRFRGAEVAVFRQERQRVEQEGGAVYPLDTSYRAHRALVEGLNDLLRPVLGGQEDPARPWREPFAPLRPDREDPGPGLAAPYVELHLAAGTKEGGALRRAADALAARIRALVESGAQVMEAGRARPLDYGDVAVLCRATYSFAAYEDALERSGLPFLTVAGRGFYGRPEIRDLLNALRALTDPADDLALAGLLRSPAVALTDASLALLCQERWRAGPAASLWEVLRAGAAPLPADQAARARRAVSLIGGLHEQAGRTPAAGLLKAFLDATGYRAALIQAGQARAARNVAKLLADAQASGIAGVGELLETLAAGREAGTREGEARSTAEGAIQVMTVHAAKGLEFPVVALGDVTYERRGGNGLLFDPALGILLPLKDDLDRVPALYRLGSLVEADQEGAENDRLLYVAATRAREVLLLSGCVGVTDAGTLKKAAGWLGRLAGAGVLGLEGTPVDCAEGGPPAAGLDLFVGGTPVCCTVYGPGYAPPPGMPQAPAGAEPPCPLPPPWLAPLVPARREAGAPEAEREDAAPLWVQRVVPSAERPHSPAWVIGSLVHEALAAWRFPAGGTGPSFAHWATARARAYGLTDSRELANAVGESRRLLARFRAHALWQEMDGAERRLHEVPYSLVVEGEVETGSVDALYRHGGQWTIVEFKTDEVRGEAALRYLLAAEDYPAQAARYRSAVHRLLGEEPRLLLCLLNYAAGVRILPL